MVQIRFIPGLFLTLIPIDDSDDITVFELSIEM
jgi:hypothetical protein